MKTEKSALHTHSIKHLSLVRSLSLEEQSSVSIKQPAHIHFSGLFICYSSADKRTPIPKMQGRQFLDRESLTCYTLDCVLNFIRS